MRILRRLSAFGRVAIALGLLAVLWIVTVAGVERATDQAQDRRVQDRLLLARAAVQPLQAWLDAARAETRQLAAAIGAPPGARTIIEGYLRGSHAFGTSVLVVDRQLDVVAASGDRLASIARKADACTQVGEGGEVADPTFPALVSAAAGTVSPVFPLPGTCAPGVAVAAPTSQGAVAVVFAGIDDLRARVDAAAAVVPSLTVLVVTADGETLAPGDNASSAPRPGLANLVGDRSRERAARHRSGDARYVGAFAPAGDGWGVVVDEEEGTFELAPTQRPALRTAGVLTAVFALAFAIVAWFDIRRRRAARRADEHRNAFLSIVGHELRTPLTVIKGYTETLASRWDSLDDARRQMLVESMAPQAQRQARVIEHLLTAAAIHAGTYARPIIGPTELRPLLGEVVAEFGPMAPLHEFELSVAEGAEGASTDAAVLEQVMGELVDNAVKYSPSGGVVAVVARRVGRHVEIAVEDDGVGLPSYTGHLFDAFVQGEAVDRRVHDEGGVGVGLYIVRNLVEAMGGSVRVEPRQLAGARAVVSLRVARIAPRIPAGGAT